MSLQRKAIRRELRRLLLHRTIAQGRWSTDRSEKIWEGELPAGVIYTRREQWRLIDDSPRTYLRGLQIWIEIFVAEKAGVLIDDQVDDFAAQVEGCILPNISLPDCPVDIKVDETMPEEWEIDYSAAGRKLIGAARWSLAFPYTQEVFEGDLTRMDPLTTVGVKWDFPPPDAEIEAEDTLPIDQSAP